MFEFADRYTPQELNYFPLNTALYSPHKMLKSIFSDPNAVDDTEEDDDAPDDANDHISIQVRRHLILIFPICIVWNLIYVKFYLCDLPPSNPVTINWNLSCRCFSLAVKSGIYLYVRMNTY